MKIALVDPVLLGEQNYSLGILNLATILKGNKIDCEIIRLQSVLKKENRKEKQYFEALGEYILQKDVDIVGLSCTCENYHIWLQAAKFIKDRNKKIKIFLGGPQATLTARETMEQFNFIDFIMLGESETNILQTVEAIQCKKSLETISGIIYRDCDKIYETGKLELMSDLDKLPFPEYELLEHLNKIDIISIEAGRGCPYGCTYCASKSFWKQKFRLKTVNRLIKEIEILVEKYHKNKIEIVHDLFTLNKSYIIEFCKQLLEKGINIEWTCSSRIDVIDKEMLSWMKRAGCTKIYFGIETGSPRMQKLINKRLDLAKIDQLLLDLQEVGIECARFAFMCGFPEETVEDLAQTGTIINKVIKYPFSKAQISKCTILPKTEMYFKYYDELKYAERYSVMTENFGRNSAVQMIKENKAIFPQFFEIPSEYNDLSCKVEKIINELYFSDFYDAYRGTLNMLLSYFNDDYIKVCQAFIEKCGNKIEAACDLNQYMVEDIVDTNIKRHQALLKQVKALINQCVNEENKEIVTQMIRYEECLFNCAHFNKDYEGIFSYDVVKWRYIAHLKPDKEIIKAIIYRDGENQMKINKYKFRGRGDVDGRNEGCK